MKKEQNYEDMLKELENIVHKLESDDVDIDSLTVQLTRAKKLINDCKTRLKRWKKMLRSYLLQRIKCQIAKTLANCCED